MAVNWQALLGNDATLQAILARINAQGGDSAAQLRDTRRRDLIGYGAIPDNLGDGVNADIDPLTRDLAGEATATGLSTTAQLREAYRRAQSRSIGDVYGRGLGRSGALGQHTRENLADYQQAQGRAGLALGDQLEQAYQTHLGNVQQGFADAGTATNEALQRAIAQINAGLISGAPTPSSGAGPSTGTAAAPRNPYQPVNVGSVRTFEPKPQAVYTPPPRPAAPNLPSAGLARALRGDRGY